MSMCFHVYLLSNKIITVLSLTFILNDKHFRPYLFVFDIYT